jgi:spermidine synthase
MNRTWVLFLNVFIVATCGLVYELLAGTLASYVLGDSVTQFSLIIGIYLSALGVGAWLSGLIDKEVARAFIEVELAVALLGGLSAPLLLLSFGRLSFFHIVLYGIVFVIGVLVGLELPLLMRIVKDQLDFKELVSRVLTFDYIGALVASLLFPLFFVPQMGLVKTSLVIGMLNAAVGLWGTWLLRPLIQGGVLGLRIRGVILLILLAVGVVVGNQVTHLSEKDLYTNPIIYAETTPYQRIVVTSGRGGFQLHLNGHLQFNSVDEYRYHEALVHPAILTHGQPRRVLVLGGGDGLALREILKHPSVEAITLVDIDPAMTRFGRSFVPLVTLNQAAYDNPRVTVVNQDAMIWLEEPAEPFDVVVIDFPDPNTFALGKLYTTRFYHLLAQRLAPDGVVSIQCTSPLVARKTYWCIIRTMETAGFDVKPYHAAVPSFGVWGFALARRQPFEIAKRIPPELGLRFLNDTMVPGMFCLPADLGPLPVDVNRLDNQILVRYHESEWKRVE